MHEKDDDYSDSPQPPGICRRLFSLVMAKLMAGRIRRVTLGSSELQESSEVKGDGPAKNKLKRKQSRSDIAIHFKQTEESEENGNSTNNKLGSSGREAERERRIPQAKGKALPDTKGPKKTVGITEKGKSIVTDEPSPKQPVAHPEIQKPKPSRPLRPLLTVASNINEKTDAFLRSRKEKMRKNINLEPNP